VAARPSGSLWKVIVVASMVLLAAIPFVKAPDRFASLSTHGMLLACLFVTLGIAVRLGQWDAIHVALISTLYLGAYCLPIVGALWPLPLVIVVASYGIVLACVPKARHSVRFWRRGGIDRGTVALMTLTASGAAVALVAWRYTVDVDITKYRSVVPSGVPAWAILAGILPYALFNAAFEEFVWRGGIWQASEAAFGTHGALALSTLSFGLAHYRGFPSGILGMILAAIYGLMMGIVRLRTKGLLGPWLAHVLADVVIFTLVAAMVVF
jgi:uncharacterized protein